MKWNLPKNQMESLSEELIETPLECFEWNETTIIKYIGSDPNVVIPKDATTIGANAFKDNKVIESVVINENITSIETMPLNVQVILQK